MIVLRKLGGKLVPILQGARERIRIGSGSFGGLDVLSFLPGLTLVLFTLALLGMSFLMSHGGIHLDAMTGLSGMMIGQTAVATRPAKVQKKPFSMGTRRRIQTIGQYVFAAGAPVPTIQIPQVGLISKVYLKLEGTITHATGAGVINPLGYASLISRIRLSANLGSAQIVDASGAGVELANYWYAPTSGRVQNTYANGAGANAVSYGLMVPVNANDRSLLQLGLINLQAEQLRLTLDITPAATLAEFVQGGTPGALTSSLTLYVAYEYWDVPNPARYELPPASICRILEEQQLITATGDQTYPIPRLGTLAQLSEYYILGAATASRVMATLTAPTPQVSRFRLRANKTDMWLDYDARFAEIEEEMFYNTAGASFMRPGVRTWDFFHSGTQSRNFGDRDLIDTERITTLEMISTVDASVTPSAVTSRNIVRRVFQRLV